MGQCFPTFSLWPLTNLLQEYAKKIKKRIKYTIIYYIYKRFYYKQLYHLILIINVAIRQNN